MRRGGLTWPSAHRALVVLAVYFGLRLLWLVHPLLLTTFLGLLFGLVAARGADHLERLRIPRGLGAALTVLGLYALLAGIVAFAAPTLQRQFAELRSHLPEATDRVEQWLATHQGNLIEQLLGSGESGAGPASSPPATPPMPATGSSAAKQPPSNQSLSASGGAGTPGARGAGAAAPRLRRTLARQLGAASRYLFPFLSSTLEVVAGLLLITFVAIYFSIDPDLYRRGLLRLLPHGRRQRADEVMTAMGVTLRRWLLTQLIAMIAIGVALTVVLKLLGVQAALSLGIIAGLLEFIPTIGPILSALPAIAMGFLVSPEKALAVALACLVIQQLEGHLLIPLLMKQGMDLPPLLTILGQALMALVFGFLGLLIAVPLIATLVVAVKMLYVEDVLGDTMKT